MKKIISWVVFGIAVAVLSWMWWNFWLARSDEPAEEPVSGAGATAVESLIATDRKEGPAQAAVGKTSAAAPPTIRAEDITSLAQWANLVRAGADPEELRDWLDDLLFSEPDAVRQLRALLRGENATFRLKVAQWLGRLGTARAAELLIGMVNDETDDRAGAEYSDILSGWRSAGCSLSCTRCSRSPASPKSWRSSRRARKPCAPSIPDPS